MRDLRGVGRVLGVDLGARQARKLDFDEMPGSWRCCATVPPAPQAAIPPAVADVVLLNVTILYSMSRQDERGG